ncbi:hypothetical protein RvY_09128 [Ramazzottius varieornatus]|uniref:Uncharacterized protein n=1 Tax=Ramazzottius varieornatus TaxID=947166 RepID=A0A1D1VAR0_RAMVA|nr:hypothetical protein RvY_09128 [Ramazzottius varieornatus]
MELHTEAVGGRKSGVGRLMTTEVDQCCPFILFIGSLLFLQFDVIFGTVLRRLDVEPPGESEVDVVAGVNKYVPYAFNVVRIIVIVRTSRCGYGSFVLVYCPSAPCSTYRFRKLSQDLTTPTL